MKRITSRVMKGTILAGGTDSPIDVINKATNKRIAITHNPNGESFTAFDGTSGWMGNTGRPAREMPAEVYLGLRLEEIFQQLRPGRPETIAGRDCVQLIGTRPNRPPVRFDFDGKSGLLQRVVRYGETPLGRNPTQIAYAAYREVDGVKIPCRWTLARPNGRFTIQITGVKTNVPVEDSRFVKPAGEVK